MTYCIHGLSPPRSPLHINSSFALYPVPTLHMLTLGDTENGFDKIQYVFIIKVLKKKPLATEGTSLQIITSVYYKPITNIIVSK